MRRLGGVFLFVLAFGCMLARTAHAADDYPSRPIRMIVPFPPGGSNDIVGRLAGGYLAERLGKSVIIDNRGGAGSVLGTEIAAKAPADGYTLLVVSVSHSFSSALYRNLPYETAKSFIAVSKLGSGPNALGVFPGLPVKSVKELITLAKAKPGQLNFGISGIGSSQHLSAELFKRMAGVDIVVVPFKGGAPAMLDVIAGNTQIAIGTVIQVLPQVRSGKLRGLATAGKKRSFAMPELPTIDEAGVPGYEAGNWWGVFVPAKTPLAIVSRLDKEFAAVMKLDEVRKRLAADGAEPEYLSQGGFAKFVAAESEKWSRVVKEAGLKPQ
jgi:tripartite-type tricarboxylate transporter receptor subunit TctC